MNIDKATVTIASGASLSNASPKIKSKLLGIIIPTMTSAAISFQVSADGTTYYDLYDDSGVEVSYSAGTHNKAYASRLELVGWEYVKVRSGLTGAGVNQGADRTITLVLGG